MRRLWQSIRHFREQQGLFMMFLRSYILIVAILLLFSLLSYVIAIDRISDSVEQLNTAVLDGIRTTLDNQFRTVEQLSFRLTSLGTTMKLAYLDKTNVDYYPEMTRYVKNLWTLWLENDTLTPRMYVYFAQAEIIASPATFYEYADFYGSFFRYGDLSSEEFAEFLLQSRHHMHYLPATSVWLNDEAALHGTRPLVLYLYHLKSQRSQDNPPGAIFYLIDPVEIVKMLRQLEIGPGGLAAVLDDEHHIVALLDHDSGIAPDRLAGLATGDLSSIPGRMLVRATSDLNGWSYLALGNPAVVMRPVVTLRRIFIALFFISLLGGFAMAYSMARKRSLPLFQLACRLSSRTRPEQQMPTGSVKAYQSIEQGVEQMLQSNLSLQEKLRAVNPTLLSAFVHQLLNGEFIQEAEVFDAVRRYEVSLPRQPYCLVSFFLPQMRGLFAQSREQVLQAMTAQDAVAECLHYLIDGTLLLSKAGVDETIWIHSMADCTDEQDLLDLLDKVARWFDEHQITMSIRYSRRYSELSNSWWELAQLRHASQGLRALPQSSRVELVWSDPDTDQSQYMQLVEMLLQSMVQSGDERMLARFLDIVRKEIFTDSQMDVAARQVMIQQFHELAVRLTGQPIDLAEFANSDPTAHFAQVSAVILASSKAASQVRLKTGSFLLSKIHRYVEQQLYNPDLSMTLIADAMSISENYLSRFFKEQCGETLASFIENGRIRQAQAQLLQTMCTVSEIAAAVGYNSDHVFRRAFRRVTGMSPNEYRERNSSS